MRCIWLQSKALFLNNVIAMLKKRYGSNLRSALKYSNAWELLVATMLSAQAQDRQVNIATERLFREHKNISDYAGMAPKQLYKYINSVGIYRNKSKNIINAAKKIVNEFDSKVPQSMEGLTSLPGVGRKTANIVLYNWFGKDEGIAIDTHCIRVSNRLGLAHTENAEKIEKELMKYADRKDWGQINHLFIALGRDACTARLKQCDRCVLSRICPSSTVKK